MAAAVAALIAALFTSALAALLLQRAEDRRLLEAAELLAKELPRLDAPFSEFDDEVREEQREASHTGIVYIVLNERGERIAGGAALPATIRSECETLARHELRACSARSPHGATVLAVASRRSSTPLFLAAALVAAAFAGLVAWLTSRPIARRIIAPLSRLGQRLSVLDVEQQKPDDLGPIEHVREVDQLRDTIDQLLQRVSRGIEQAQRFAANAAHELRTPLTTLRAELELLGEDQARGMETASNVARAEAKVAELSTLVERLLILATPKRTPNELAELISLRDLIEDATLALPDGERARVRTVEADVQVVGDEVLLGTLLSNALSNALKFGSTAQVLVEHTESDAIMQVDDDGPGLGEQDRERVFEPFFRASESLQHRIPGHGLGLALIRHIAEAHGGRAAFVTKPGRGARLEIRLPRANAP